MRLLGQYLTIETVKIKVMEPRIKGRDQDLTRMLQIAKANLRMLIPNVMELFKTVLVLIPPTQRQRHGHGTARATIALA